jgi:hypothetical protein
MVEAAIVPVSKAFTTPLELMLTLHALEITMSFILLESRTWPALTLIAVVLTQLKLQPFTYSKPSLTTGVFGTLLISISFYSVKKAGAMENPLSSFGELQRENQCHAVFRDKS